MISDMIYFISNTDSVLSFYLLGIITGILLIVVSYFISKLQEIKMGMMDEAIKETVRTMKNNGF